jgi:proteasome lid subunit RPN8/RPN11
VEILGNWHSHPFTPSRMSDEDLRLAVDKNASYLILSLADMNNPVLNSFSVTSGKSEKENLIII